MAIASYRDSINKRLPLHLLDRLAPVAIIPDLPQMHASHWAILQRIKSLKSRWKMGNDRPAEPSTPWSPQHLSR
jgi:hypothetical protein